MLWQHCNFLTLTFWLCQFLSHGSSAVQCYHTVSRWQPYQLWHFLPPWLHNLDLKMVSGVTHVVGNLNLLSYVIGLLCHFSFTVISLMTHTEWAKILNLTCDLMLQMFTTVAHAYCCALYFISPSCRMLWALCTFREFNPTS